MAGPAFAQWPGATAPPAPPPPETAADFAKLGVEAYKAGDFAAAIPHLEKSHELEPTNFDVRFTLAQAYRQSGSCDKAAPHYKAILANAPDPETAKALSTGAEQCPGVVEKPAPPPPPPAPPPKVIVKSGAATPANIGLLVAGGAGIGTGVALFLAARSDDQDAEVAVSFDDHERISSRADRLKILSIASAGVGVGLAVFAVYRIRVAKREQAQLALTPRHDGGVLVLGGSW
ncbi:MAG TPA: tetratricopeptide repeat protein [Kofleriaceae bacterium]